MFAFYAYPPPSRPGWRIYQGGNLGQLSPEFRPIWALLMTPANELWAANADGVFVYSDQRWWRPAMQPYLNLTEVFTWYRHNVWAGGYGLQYYADQQWQTVDVGWHWEVGREYVAVTCLVVDAHDRLWVGTMNRGLWRTPDGVAWEPVALPAHETYMTALTAASDGTVWVAALGARNSPHLYQWQHDTWERLPHPRPPQRLRSIDVLTPDARGRLWVGTGDSGIWCWADRHWHHFAASPALDQPRGLPGNSIFGLCVDAQQRIWAGTHNGLALYEGGFWRTIVVAPEPIAADRVLTLWILPGVILPSPQSLYLDQHGKLWMGTMETQVGWLDTTQPLEVDPREYTIRYYQPELVTM